MREPTPNRLSSRPPDQELISIERNLLRALCQSRAPAEFLSQARSDLQHYSWQGSDHQTIFEALLSIGSARGRSLREQLAAQATRMGFPDIDWNEYFGQAVAAEGELKRSVMDLVGEVKSVAARKR
jgi:hypothetical protein